MHGAHDEFKVAAAFRYDTSRILDLQLHTHLVFANLTWDDPGQRRLALLPKQMGEEVGSSICQSFYRELERECRKLGYETETAGEAFYLREIDREMEDALCQRRTVPRRRFENRYEALLGQPPDNKRVEQSVKEDQSAATKRFREEYEVAFVRREASWRLTNRNRQIAPRCNEPAERFLNFRLSA